MSEQNIKRLLRLINYVLVAALASAATLTFIQRPVSQDSKLDELEKLILECYIGDADSTTLRDGAAAGMIAATGDQWSYYIPADQMQSYNNHKKNSYVGIGVTISTADMSSGIQVLTVEPNGGAAAAGILPGDVIVGVDTYTVESVGGEKLGDYITGAENTKVELTVKRGSETHTFTVKRMRIEVEVATGKLLDGNVGYIRIRNFNDNCASQTIALMESLQQQGADRFLFDVRFNGGGYKEELVKLLDYLLPEGEVFHTVEYTGEESIITSDANCLQLPMAVLVNGESYSAAEFFAAALQEYDWATVVGEQTCGKSYYQYTIPLSDGSAVSLSMGKYYTPQGVMLAEVGGLTPDIVVEVDEDTANAIYSETLDLMQDAQVLAALNALKN